MLSDLSVFRPSRWYANTILGRICRVEVCRSGSMHQIFRRLRFPKMKRCLCSNHCASLSVMSPEIRHITTYSVQRIWLYISRTITSTMTMQSRCTVFYARHGHLHHCFIFPDLGIFDFGLTVDGVVCDVSSWFLLGDLFFGWLQLPLISGFEVTPPHGSDRSLNPLF